MPARDPATGRFVKSGGGTQVGSAYGRIIIDTSGVESSVGKVNKVLGTMGSSLGGVAAKMSGVLATGALALGAALAGVSLAMGGIVASGVRMAASLEQQMANIQAVMQNTDQQVELLREHILDLGIDPELKVSTMEAAQAIEMLGRNGLNTTQILEGAARSTVLLANATDAQFTTAADIATDVMALFNIEAANMITAVDGITSVVNNSKFTIDDYAMALAQGGGVAALSGVNFNDFNAAIAAISPLFRSGSDAGTSFKTMLQRMAAPTGEAWAAMQQLGLVTAEGKNAFFDAEGNMRSMAEVAGLLNTAVSGLSDQQMNQALTTIYGADAIRAAGGMARFTEEEFRALQETMGETSAANAAAIRMNTLSGALEVLQGVIETLRIRIGDVFKGDLRAAVEAFTNLLSSNADRIVGFFQIVRTVLAQFVAFVRSFVTGVSNTFGARFNQMSANANGWGRNIVMSLARGMAQAMVAVVRVLNQIGQVITHWLKPGSPPLIVPDIDDYGTGAMDAYLEGFLKGDFAIFNEIGNTITSWLRSLGDDIPEADLIPRILGTRAAIAEAIALMRETGTVSEESLNNIFEAAGVTDEALQNYIRTILQLEQANQAVAAAQENVNRIKEEYAALLEPLNDELRALRGEQTNRSEEEELAGIERRLAEERLTDAERQRLLDRQREIEIQRQIRALEEQRDTAVGAAEDELSAAEEAQAQLEEQAAAQQALINAQIENNELVREQIELLERLAEAMEDVSGGGGAGGADDLGLGSGLDLTGGLEDLGEGAGDAFGSGLEEGLESIPSAFEDAIGELMGDIEAEFEPLISAGETLGETWGGVMDAIGDRFDGLDSWIATNRSRIEGSFNGLSTAVTTMGGRFQEIWTFIQSVITSAMAVLQPAIDQFVSGSIEGLGAFEPVLQSLRELWEALGPVVDVIVALWGAQIALFVGVVTGLFNGIANAIEPFLTTIAFVVNGLVVTLTGVVDFITGFFQLLVGMNQDNNALVEEGWQRMSDGITGIVTGLTETIFGTIAGTLASVIALVEGFVDGIVGFFTNLYNELVGQSIVPDMVNGIISWFDTLVAEVVARVTALITAVGVKFLEMKADIIGKVAEIITAVLNFASAFHSVGASLMEGLRAGIMSAVGSLIAAATGLVESVIDAVWERIQNPTGPGQGANQANRSANQVGNSLRGAQSVAQSLVNTYAQLARLAASLAAPNMQALVNNARMVSAPVTTHQTDKRTYDQSKRVLNVTFGNGRDRIGAATDMNTLRAMGGGI